MKQLEAAGFSVRLDGDDDYQTLRVWFEDYLSAGEAIFVSQNTFKTFTVKEVIAEVFEDFRSSVEDAYSGH